jgi:predicted O-methyltransferase YrrM
MTQIKTTGLLSKIPLTPIHLRNTPPPAETLNHIELIKWLSSWIKPTHYLELGVRTGVCFNQIIPFSEYNTGVDIVHSDNLKNVITTNGWDSKVDLFTGTTDDYFNSLKKDTVFDLVFIDADHSYEQCLKDFLNVKDRVIKNGFVIFHDTYPYTQEFMKTKVRGECYRVPMYIKENLHPEWELVTLPFNPGLTIAKKSPGSDIWNY